MKPKVCPQRDLGLRDADGAAEFYGPGSPEAERAMELYRRATAAPVEYHLSEDPDDSDLYPERGVDKPVRFLPGRWWHWLAFANVALVGWIIWHLRGMF